MTDAPSGPPSGPGAPPPRKTRFPLHTPPGAPASGLAGRPGLAPARPAPVPVPPPAVAAAEIPVPAPPVRRGHLWALAAVVLVYAVVSLGAPSRPGLDYDESFPASVALKLARPDAPLDLLFGWGITAGGRFFPLTLSQYYGATRVYLEAAWFALGPGPSAASLRFLNVLVGAVGLLLCFRLAARWFSPKVGLWTVLFLAVDPGYLFLIRNDYSSIGLELLLRLGCLLSVARLWDGASWAREGWKLGLLILVGLWTGASFLWFLGGLVLAAVVVGRARWRRVAAEKSWLGWVALPLLLWVALFEYVQHLSKDPWGVSLLHRLVRVVLDFRVGEAVKRLSLIGHTFNGNWAESQFLGRGLPGLWFPFWEVMALALAVFLAGRFGVWSTERDRRSSRESFLLSTGAFSLGLLTLTPPVYGAHHVWVAYPVWHMFCAASLARLAAASPSFRRWGVPVLAAAVAAAGLGAAAHYHRRFAAGDVSPRWSPAIDGAARWLEAQGRPTVCLDWGLAHNLAVLTGGRLPLSEPYRDPEKGYREAGYEAAWRDRLADPARLYVLHAPAYSFRASARGSFFRIVREIGGKPRRVAVWPHRGRDFIEVYEVLPASAAPAVPPARRRGGFSGKARRAP
jgi:hypothetical protein